MLDEAKKVRLTILAFAHTYSEGIFFYSPVLKQLYLQISLIKEFNLLLAKAC